MKGGRGINGRRRSSAFWGLGCPKTHHEIKDSLAVSSILTAEFPSRGMSVPVTDLPVTRRHLIGGQWVDSSLLRRTIPRQLSPKRPLASAEAAARIGHDLLISKHPTIASNMREAVTSSERRPSCFGLGASSRPARWPI